jgi:hypothetical protein
MKLNEVLKSPLPKFMYHCTPVSNLPSIKKNGLKAGQRGIFLTDDTYQASEYCNLSPGQDCSILTIDTKGLDESQLGADEHGMEEIGHEGGGHTWQESLKHRNQIISYVDIKPEYIIGYGEPFQL